jgi:vacuole morphology and inheritance protein 14
VQGGLLCLAAIAVGLGQEDNDRFLDVIVPPVLDSFRDPDSGVRYYGLEALYNIAKVSRESFLRYFSDTFDSLFRLCADSEHRVQVLQTPLPVLLNGQQLTRATPAL